MKTASEIMQEQISKLSDAEKSAIFPPIERKNFVVRKSWYGRNQVIKFRTKPSRLFPEGQEVEYNHDIALDLLKPHLETTNAWKKYGYWSQSTDLPMQLRFRDLMKKETKKESKK